MTTDHIKYTHSNPNAKGMLPSSGNSADVGSLNKPVELLLFAMLAPVSAVWPQAFLGIRIQR